MERKTQKSYRNIELNWPGKRPFTGIPYCPARRTESHGNPRNNWMNRIYLGDNIRVMSSLLEEFHGKIDLIYMDPPFNSGINYKQFSDVWKNTEYLQFIYDRLALMHELLADTGSIYLHCDWHVSHQVRLLMDEVFGPENFRNEIAWCYLVNKGHFKNKFPPRHDTILFYAKTKGNYFNAEAVRMAPSAATIKRWGAYADAGGEVPFNKLTPGMKKVAGKGEKPYMVRGGIQVDWIHSIPGIHSGNSNENTGYPTQKPEKLIEILIKASSKPADLVLDCFVGSGTSAAAAMKLGRRFIGVDSNPGAISTVVTRILADAETINLRTTIDSPSRDIDAYYTGFEVYTCPAPETCHEQNIATTPYTSF